MLTITTDKGCTGIVTKVPFVYPKPSACAGMDTVCIKYGRGPEVFLPTAFSPNGDGINDRLFFRAVQVQVTHIAIFNRWGQTVFSTNDINQYWDGTFQGRIQVSGEYSWLVKGIGPGNKPFIKEGSISLLR